MTQLLRFLFLVIIITISFQPTASAQLNIKIGYSLGFSNPKILNDITARYNADRPWLERSFKELRTTNGLIAGLRYRLGDVGLEFTWHNKFKIFRAEGLDPSTDKKYFQDIYFRYSSFSLGFENYLFDKFGWGASIDYSSARFRTESTDIENRSTISNKNGLSSHFYLSINTRSNDILTLSIKPYVQIPWSKISVFDLEKSLHPSSTGVEDQFQEDFINFGIMLVFYNGQW